MKAFITGGTGFIGSHLVDALLAEKSHQLRCLVRSDPKWIAGKPVQTIKGDLHDIDALKKGMHEADVVFHLAAIVKAPDKKSFTINNVDATENILRTAQRSGVKKLIILSSLAATGPSFGRPVDETDPLMPVSKYGHSKKEMELMVKEFSTPELPITILRPPAVYGPREDQIFSLFRAAKLGLFPVIGEKKANRLSLVHVDDVVQGLILAEKFEHKGVETFFISSEQTYSWDEVRAAMAKAFNRKITKIRFNPGVVKKISAIYEDIASVIGKYPVINRDKAAELVLEWTCSVEKAKKNLNYRQSVPLEEGIRQTIHWYKIHNWL